MLRTGQTYYSKAFTRAFDLLKGTSARSGSSRNKVIIFLTEGAPNDSKTQIMQTIKTKNAELNNEVVILTYGMLMKEKDLQILRDIASHEGHNVTWAPDVTVSTLTISLSTPGMLHFC